MADILAAKRARMACRIYLKLYDVGPEGAPVLKEDAIGPAGNPAADMAVALEVLARMVDDTVLDEPSHKGGVPHYALTAAMRDRMGQEFGKPTRLADQIRDALARVDAGDASRPADLLHLEAMVRTGHADAGPL